MSARPTCDEADQHIPGCWNPAPSPRWRDADGVTACTCGDVWWPGKVGTWHAWPDGTPYFLHAQGCADRIVPDEYAIEADPGRLTASFPTFATYDEARAAHDTLRSLGGGVPNGMDEKWPRVLFRTEGGPWMADEPTVEYGHLCAAVEPATAAEAWRVLGSDAARAVGRFKRDGPDGYRAKSGGPLRATRAEAEADEREHHSGGSHAGAADDLAPPTLFDLEEAR